MQNDRVFEHHMLQEIHEQPRAVGDTIAEHLSEYRKTGRLIDLPVRCADFQSLPWLRIVASGTSRYAGLYGKYVIEELAGIPVDVDYASEFICRRSASANRQRTANLPSA